MGVMVQIRDLDEALHAEIKRRAAESHQSISDWLKTLIRQNVVVRRPPNEVIAAFHARHPDLAARFRDEPDVNGMNSTVAIIRQARRDRDLQLSGFSDYGEDLLLPWEREGYVAPDGDRG